MSDINACPGGCGTDVRVAEVFMLLPESWEETGLAPDAGWWCRACCEARAGRRFTLTDFDRCPASTRHLHARGEIDAAEHDRRLNEIGDRHMLRVTPDGLRHLADMIESAKCTGIAASWCPRHGRCRCPVEPDGSRESLDDPRCPLHAPGSSHAESALEGMTA